MLDACVAVQMTHLYFLILVLMVKKKATASPVGLIGLHIINQIKNLFIKIKIEKHQ